MNWVGADDRFVLDCDPCNARSLLWISPSGGLQPVAVDDCNFADLGLEPPAYPQLL